MIIMFYSTVYILIALVRLADGPSPHIGRVEVYTSIDEDNNAAWGTICDDGWDFRDARVVCRQLGYRDAVAAPLFAHYGQGTGPIFLDGVHCTGTELDIFMCLHYGVGVHDCDHSEDASVDCLGILKYEATYMHMNL